MNESPVDSFSSLSPHTHTLPPSSLVPFPLALLCKMDFSCRVIIIINLADRFASEQFKTHLLQCQAAAGGHGSGRAEPGRGGEDVPTLLSPQTIQRGRVEKTSVSLCKIVSLI